MGCGCGQHEFCKQGKGIGIVTVKLFLLKTESLLACRSLHHFYHRIFYVEQFKQGV